jgi:Ca-activated chloride channel family protein
LTGYKKDRQGQTVISKLNETMLQQIAAAGGGKFVMANNSRNGLERILEEINEFEKMEFETRTFSDYEDRFQYFIGFAILFLLLEFALMERRSRWNDRIKIFNRK